MNHHHHSLDHDVPFYHSHPDSLHDDQGQHPDKPDWSPGHYGHNHDDDSVFVGGSEGTPSVLHLSGSTHITVGVAQDWPA